jgi:integrase/recombinase XerD
VTEKSEAVYSIMKKVVLKEIFHRGKYCIAAYFGFDPKLSYICKEIGCRWSSTFSCWYVENTQNHYNALMSSLGAVSIIDANQLERAFKLRIIIQKERSLRPNYKELTLNDKASIWLEKYKGLLASRRYSMNTQETYISALKCFFHYFSDMDPIDLTINDFHDFNLNHLRIGKYSVAYQRQFVCAIKLFYGYYANHEFDIDKLIRPKKEKYIPIVLSKEEVSKVLSNTHNLKHKVLMSTLYSTGMRVGELLAMRITDIDRKEQVIWVRHGKGAKDRKVQLSQLLLNLFERYYKVYKPVRYMFEGSYGMPYSPSSVNKVIKDACRKCGIVKRVTAHTFRHSYATHMLEGGIDLRYIQELLGHSSSKTTEIYTHVSSKKLKSLDNPFDHLNIDLGEPLVNYTKSAISPPRNDTNQYF